MVMIMGGGSIQRLSLKFLSFRDREGGHPILDALKEVKLGTGQVFYFSQRFILLISIGHIDAAYYSPPHPPHTH